VASEFEIIRKYFTRPAPSAVLAKSASIAACFASVSMYAASPMFPAWNRNTEATAAASRPLRMPPSAAGRSMRPRG